MHENALTIVNQQQVMMHQNLGIAQYGQITSPLNPNDPSLLVLPHHPSQDSSSFAVNQYMPLVDNSPSSAPVTGAPRFSLDGQPTADDAPESPKIISLEVLKTMLREPVTEKPYIGLLPDGQAYAPGPTAKRGEDDDSKIHYLLFSSKAAYIAYYINYYFSEANLVRDTFIKSLMLDGHSLPLAKLLEFPRLEKLKTSVADLEAAVANNKHLQMIRVGTELCVKRIDVTPANLNRPDVASAPPTVTVAPESFSGKPFDTFQFGPAVSAPVWSDAQNAAPSSQTSWSSQSSVPVTSPRAPIHVAPFIQPQPQPIHQLPPQPYNSMLLAMNSLNLGGLQCAGGGVRYFVPPNSGAGQGEYYQAGPSAGQQLQMSGQPMLFVTPQGVYISPAQGQTPQGSFAAQGLQPQVLPTQHPGLLPPGMMNFQQQQALAAALQQQQQQQQYVAMQQGLVAATNPLRYYVIYCSTGSSTRVSSDYSPVHSVPHIPSGMGQQYQTSAHQQLLQQANVVLSSGSGGPPPGLAQPVHWSNGQQQSQPQQSQQQQIFPGPTMSLGQGAVTPVLQSNNTSPPGMPPKTIDSGAGTPIPVEAQPETRPQAVNPVSSSGRSSSSGIASQNSSSVNAGASGGSSSSVSSVSTDANSKHPYAAVVAKAPPKAEEVSVANLGAGQGYHHRGGGGTKSGYYNRKMNSGSFEENNNHSWRGGHRNGPMRGGRGSYGHYNPGYAAQGPPRNSGDSSAAPSKRGDGPQPLAQKG
ncbi:hypothetical protein Ciccas_001057 [Cichlidogyrus casuarinus]|uniref:HTH La-type RNA-binding domain-containing protein n=1 Tax=Cichlidogyrus casuarinus TaxID=1844966 RepID=A0ABD2QL39_9PLAT